MFESLGIINFVRAMGGTVISSFTDPFNLVMAHGLGRMFKTGIAPMIRDFHQAYWAGDSALRQNSRLAAANMEWVLSDRIAQMAELHSIDGGDRSLAFMRNMAKKFSFLSGITQWNDMLKQVAYNVSQARVIEHARTGYANVGAADRAWMLSLGIDQKMLARIADAHAAQPIDTQKMGGMFVGDWHNWADEEAGRKFASAMGRESANAIITPQIGDRPLSAHTPAGRAIFQFRGFMLSTHSRVMGRNIALMNVGIRNGEYGRAMSVMTGMAGLVLMWGGSMAW